MNIARVASWSIIEPALGFTNSKKHSPICYLLGCWGIVFWFMVLSVLSIQKPVPYRLEKVVRSTSQWGAPQANNHWDLLLCVPSAEQLPSKVVINITGFCRSNWQRNTKPFQRDFTVRSYYKSRASFKVLSHSVHKGHVVPPPFLQITMVSKPSTECNHVCMDSQSKTLGPRRG